MKKICLALLLLSIPLLSSNVDASEGNLDGGTPALESERSEIDNTLFLSRVSNSRSISVKEGGKLTSNVWLGSKTTSGNSLQWDYQVSANYNGSAKVSSIRTTWQGSASLRSSASLSLGISLSGANATSSSSWQTVTTPQKYWENNNGSKEASYRSNMVVAPKKDYRDNTVSMKNTAKLYIKGNSKPYEITASV